MGKYNERIADKSIWLTATPMQKALMLPFYMTEAGRFYAEPDYEVNRQENDSYLFLYTQNGCGIVTSGGVSVELPIGSAIVIDCHKSHNYASYNGEWEFLWIHLKGSSVKTFFDILYPNDIFAINIINQEELAAKTEELMYKIQENDILNSARLSAGLHDLFNMLIEGSLRNEQEKNRERYSEYVEAAINLIQQRYSETITIDDIMDEIPLSKYYFIRIFKRMIGTTPYNYLTNYRINAAKIFLQTTDMPVFEIAGKCGFMDISNFIMQFKKHTGQKPVEYRRYFQPY